VTRIRAYIAEDEPLARDTVRQLLQAHPDIEVAGEGWGPEVPAAVRALRPELLLLDIQMPGMDGFQVLEALGADVPPAVVFVTAHDAFAVRAFEVHAADYVLKPFTDARFHAAVRHALSTPGRGPAVAEALSARLVFRDRGRLEVVVCDEIDWIEAADYYASVHVGAASHLVRESLNDLERRLDPRRFVRVHRSAIVNVDRVKALQPHLRGDAVVILRDGTRVKLSRNRRDAFERALESARPVGGPESRPR
jgi:two-component system, LytTR family, response regulator